MSIFNFSAKTTNTHMASYWMIAALVSFSVLAIAVKELSSTIAPAEIIFFRSMVSLLILVPLIYLTDKSQFKTLKFKQHSLRNIAHYLGQYGWIVGITFLPLAEVFALEFTVPIWTAIIATLFLKEKLTRSRVLAIFLGVFGVLVILRPGIEIIHLASIAVLFGAFSYAVSHTLTKSLVATESPMQVIFYMSLIQLPIALVLMINHWVTPTTDMWVWIILTSTMALLAHFSMAKALTYADATIVVPMDFLRLPLIIFLGWIFYAETVTWFLVVGAMIMLSGNLLNLKKEPA